MKKVIILLALLVSFSFSSKDKDDVLKEKVSFLLDSYTNYLNGIGDISYEYEERKQNFTGKFLELFASVSDPSMCYNDLDPSNQTSKTHTAKEYADHALIWYNGNTGLTTKFIGEYKFGKPSTQNGLNYIPVYVTKEVKR